MRDPPSQTDNGSNGPAQSFSAVPGPFCIPPYSTHTGKQICSPAEDWKDPASGPGSASGAFHWISNPAGTQKGRWYRDGSSYGSNFLLNQLLARETDAIFLLGSQNLYDQKEVYYFKLADDQFMVVVSKKNPLSRQDRIRISDLKDEKIIMPSPDSSIRKRIDQLFLSAGITPHIICESSQSDTSTQLAAGNFGISFSSSSIAAYLDDGRYRAIPLEPLVTRPIYFAVLKRTMEYPPIQALVRYFEEIAKDSSS